MSLPGEVTQHIFSFLSPCEIVRLRQVSKHFLDITYDPTLWRKIYASAGNVDLLLPPGPFLSQSTQYLERTLVESELVSRTWTSQPLRVLLRTETSWKLPQREGVYTIVFGRWCISLEEKNIQCHDIDTDTRGLLYDGSAHPLFWFSACTTVDSDGRRVYLLLNDRRLNQLIRLLEFRVNDDSFSEPETMDLTHIKIQSIITSNSTIDFHHSVHFIVVSRHQPCMVFDLRTRYLYRLPAPEVTNELIVDHSTRNEPPGHPRPTQFILTKTHIISVQMYMPFQDMPALIRAFAIPDATMLHDRNSGGVGELHLTHQIATRILPHSVRLLRNSVVDPGTGSVNIRLLHIATTQLQSNGSGQKHMSCLDLTLPRPASTTDALPISIHSQDLFEFVWSSEQCTASDNGYARGILFTFSGFPHGTSARKFTIDASGEECTIAVGDLCPFDLPGYPAAFDGSRARIHSLEFKNHADRLVTADLA